MAEPQMLLVRSVCFVWKSWSISGHKSRFAPRHKEADAKIRRQITFWTLCCEIWIVCHHCFVLIKPHEAQAMFIIFSNKPCAQKDEKPARILRGWAGNPLRWRCIMLVAVVCLCAPNSSPSSAAQHSVSPRHSSSFDESRLLQWLSACVSPGTAARRVCLSDTNSNSCFRSIRELDTIERTPTKKITGSIRPRTVHGVRILLCLRSRFDVVARRLNTKLMRSPQLTETQSTGKRCKQMSLRDKSP